MTLSWLVLAAAIATATAGQILLKLGTATTDFVAQLFDWRTMVGLVCYGGAALLYILALRRIPMSVALPSSASSYVVLALIGHFGFGEPMGIQQVGAIALICGGVVLLALA
jgi:multidrug transporter EmrE-like cation transporter